MTNLAEDPEVLAKVHKYIDGLLDQMGRQIDEFLFTVDPHDANIRLQAVVHATKAVQEKVAIKAVQSGIPIEVISKQLAKAAERAADDAMTQVQTNKIRKELNS